MFTNAAESVSNAIPKSVIPDLSLFSPAKKGRWQQQTGNARYHDNHRIPETHMARSSVGTFLVKTENLSTPL